MEQYQGILTPPLLLGNIVHVDGLVQERRNSIANALELRLSYTNPSVYQRTADCMLKKSLPTIQSTSQDAQYFTDTITSILELPHENEPLGNLKTCLYFTFVNDVLCCADYRIMLCRVTKTFPCTMLV